MRGHSIRSRSISTRRRPSARSSAACAPRAFIPARCMMRMLAVDLLAHATSLGSPGIDEVRWLKPVRPGDVLTSRFLCSEKRALGLAARSRHRPDPVRNAEPEGRSADELGLQPIPRGAPSEDCPRLVAIQAPSLARSRRPAASRAPTSKASGTCPDRAQSRQQFFRGPPRRRDLQPRRAHLHPRRDHRVRARIRSTGLPSRRRCRQGFAVRRALGVRLAHDRDLDPPVRPLPPAHRGADARGGPHAGPVRPLARLQGSRWLKPVYPGDTIEFRGRIAEMLDWKNRPDRGLIVTDNQGRNQKDEIVFAIRGQIFAERRHPL